MTYKTDLSWQAVLSFNLINIDLFFPLITEEGRGFESRREYFLFIFENTNKFEKRDMYFEYESVKSINRYKVYNYH